MLAQVSSEQLVEIVDYAEDGIFTVNPGRKIVCSTASRMNLTVGQLIRRTISQYLSLNRPES